MKFRFIPNVQTLLAGLLLAVSNFSNAGLIDSSEWEVTDISGSWDAATSGYWLTSSTPTASEADGYMSDGYIAYPSSSSSPQNGYSTFTNSSTSVLEITFEDAYNFSNIDLWITRNNSSATTVNLFGQNSGSGSESLLSTTTGGLGLSRNWSFDIKTGSLGLTSASSYNQIRLEFGTQAQVILHELVFEGNSISVPEPSTFAVFALGIMGLTLRRFKK